MVDSGSLNDDRQVTSRTDRKRMAYNLVSKILCIFLMKSQTVVFLISVPLLKLDNKIDRLGILNTLDTKQCFYIDDTDASKFDKMTCDIRWNLPVSHH